MGKAKEMYNNLFGTPSAEGKEKEEKRQEIIKKMRNRTKKSKKKIKNSDLFKG